MIVFFDADKNTETRVAERRPTPPLPTANESWGWGIEVFCRRAGADGGTLLRGLGLVAFAALFMAGRAGEAMGEQPTAPKTTAPKAADPKSIVVQLADPSYQRREIATRQLIAAGDAAVAPLEAAIREGDLELVERAIMILQDLATLETPGDATSAWDALSRLEKTGPGAASSRASAAKSIIRSERSERARARLEVAGVTVGFQELTLGSEPNVWNAVRFPAEWNGSKEALEWLPWIYESTMAVIEGNSASPEVLEAVGRMPKIRQIQIRDAELSADAIRSLAELKRIDVLELLFVRIGKAAEDLPAVAELPLRHTLILTGTDFDEAAVETLRQQLPGLEITFSRGGFLGVQCNPMDLACTIQQVVAGSAADRAQLQPRDVITKFGEHPVQRFVDLQKAVRRYTPADKLEVTIIRDGRELVLPIQLGRQ